MAQKGDTEIAWELSYSGQEKLIFIKQQLSLSLGNWEEELIFYCIYGDIQNSKAWSSCEKNFHENQQY